MSEQPQRVAVIDGGYIGVELSGVLNALGSQVTIIAKEDRLMQRFDPMISEILEKEMTKQQIQVRTIDPTSAEELVTMQTPVLAKEIHHDIENGLEWQEVG